MTACVMRPHFRCFKDWFISIRVTAISYFSYFRVNFIWIPHKKGIDIVESHAKMRHLRLGTNFGPSRKKNLWPNLKCRIARVLDKIVGPVLLSHFWMCCTILAVRFMRIDSQICGCEYKYDKTDSVLEFNISHQILHARMQILETHSST
jgi:hypothetical protein